MTTTPTAASDPVREAVVFQLVEEGRAKHRVLNDEQQDAADSEARAFYRKVIDRYIAALPPPAPAEPIDVAGVREDMAKRLFWADVMTAENAEYIDPEWRDGWWKSSSEMPLSGPGFVRRWLALADAALTPPASAPQPACDCAARFYGTDQDEHQVGCATFAEKTASAPQPDDITYAGAEMGEVIEQGRDALRYVLNWSESNTRVSTVMRTFTLNGEDRHTTKDRLEALYAALAAPSVTDDKLRFAAVVGKVEHEQIIDSVLELLRLINGGARFTSIRALAHAERETKENKR